MQTVVDSTVYFYPYQMVGKAQNRRNKVVFRLGTRWKANEAEQVIHWKFCEDI